MSDLPGYADRLRALFAGWRRQFGADTRILVVQLSNYGPTAETPSASGWAEVREQQRRAAADTDVALPPTLDVGENDNLHPVAKLPVGRHLAAAAQGQPMPLPLSARLWGDRVEVTFSGLEGGLHDWSGPPLRVELSRESQESRRYAAAEVSDGSPLIRTDGRPASRVRHAWADSPLVNLHDARPLPVPTFELPIAP